MRLIKPHKHIEMSFFKGGIEFEKKRFLLSFSKKLCTDVVKNTANIL